jgi:hypothetical protein
VRKGTVIIAGVLLMACKGEEKPLGIDQMKVIVWDLICSEQYALGINNDSILKPDQRTIETFRRTFVQDKVSKEQFYSSFRYYNGHPDQQKILFDSVIAYGTRQREQLNKPVKKQLKELGPLKQGS